MSVRETRSKRESQAVLFLTLAVAGSFLFKAGPGNAKPEAEPVRPADAVNTGSFGSPFSSEPLGELPTQVAHLN